MTRSEVVQKSKAGDFGTKLANEVTDNQSIYTNDDYIYARQARELTNVQQSKQR